MSDRPKLRVVAPDASRRLPHSSEIERSLLGGLLLDPTQLRAEAKSLRARARQLDSAARALEDESRLARALTQSCAAQEARASAYCRPVWREGRARGGGPWIVLAVQDGAVHVCRPPPDSGGAGRDLIRYRIGTGIALDGWTYEERRTYGELDSVATIAAWRAWCAERRAREVTRG